MERRESEMDPLLPPAQAASTAPSVRASSRQPVLRRISRRNSAVSPVRTRAPNVERMPRRKRSLKPGARGDSWLPLFALTLVLIFSCALYVTVNHHASPISDRVTPAPGVRVSLLTRGLNGARSVVYCHCSTSSPHEAYRSSSNNTPIPIMAPPSSDSKSHLLVLARHLRMIIKVDAAGNRTPVLDWTGLGLNHAMVLARDPQNKQDMYLIASSADAVYAWRYNCSADYKSAKLDVDMHQVLISNINGASGGKHGHKTRSLEFDSETGHLYVSIGSVSNVDADSSAAQIRRFNIFAKSYSQRQKLTKKSPRSKIKLSRAPWSLVIPDDNQIRLGIKNGDANEDDEDAETDDEEDEFNGPELPVPEGGFDFVKDGELWADGIRNSVAQTWDARGRLWEANHGPEDLLRSDFGVHQSGHEGHGAQPLRTLEALSDDNPAEEINLLANAKTFYGYPFCFTAGNVTESFEIDPLRGSQWAWQANQQYKDSWCKNVSNNQPPAAHLPAQSSPISMTFLKKEDGCGKMKGVSFPCDLVGNLIVALHGSRNRDVPTGYSVVMIPFENGLPQRSKSGQLNSIITLAHASGVEKYCRGVNGAVNCFKPTGVTVFKERGTIFVVSDVTGELVELSFDSNYNIPRE
ncbi:hypothetical protein CcCBS67573_g06989 [Chytriomyces confervae]|uniref:Pyrroloquinoline quinone-dependent pyranose dehydrogenase beta-propeller domain-containing protein n=1 Tax=Chytriomyces confervae TaxID=246404 RepID=A0A507F0F2_9FUNG|nr:hypothetical protein HDU80_007448 [Chytriomyces hyalinus]TPX68976.1 hypothetical protein CcCBS67573_g06989 [Chytriomyces confervae]